MRNISHLFIFLLFAILGGESLCAAESVMVDDYYTKFRNLTSLDGLSHNRILDIKQDQYGFIWLATAHGLNRYDGYTFKTFVHDSNDSTSIPGNYVTSIDFDINGKMWVGTKTGLASYNTASESFTCFCIHSKEKFGISDPYVRRLTADVTQALLWVETVDGTLNCLNLETPEIQHFKHKRVLATTYDYHELYQDLRSCVWIGGRDFGPLKFNHKQLTFLELPVDGTDHTKKRDSDIASIFQDNDSLYWMSATDGFYQYYPHSNTFQKYLGTSTFDIIEDDSVSLWLGTGAGLMKYHKYNDEFTVFQHNSNNDHSLVYDHVNVLFKDRNENLWIGTAKGLSILYKKNNTFTHYRHIPEVKQTMPSDYVRTFLALNNGKVWIGTHGGGVIEWDRGKSSFETVKGTEGKRISTMYQDKLGDIWLGMWSGKGFLKYNKNKKITHYAYDHNTLKRDWYNDFYEDDKGRFWTGIWGANGVHFFNRTKGEFEKYSLRLPETYMRTQIDKVAVQDDAIWMHCSGNFSHRFDTKKAQFEGWGIYDTTDFVLPEWQHKHHYHYDENIGYTAVFQIVEDRENALSYWCTNDGLYVFENNAYKKLFSNDFNLAYYMAVTSDKHLYLCTDKGLFSTNVETYVSKHLALDNASMLTKVFAINDTLLLLTNETKALLYNTRTEAIIKRHLNSEELEILCTTNAVLSGENVSICTDKGLVILDKDLSGYTLYNMNNSFSNGLLSENINGIVKTSDSTFWLATGKGLLRYNKNTATFTIIEKTHNNPIKGIALKDNALWMATFQGLAYYMPENEDYGIISNRANHLLSSHLISFIEEDTRGNIWVGTTNKGVNILDKKNYNIHQFLPNKNSPMAFWGEDASDFAINKDHLIFISSNQGINVYHPFDSTFSHITTQDGLPSDDVLGIEFDNDGFLWILTSEALSVYDPNQECIKIFDRDWGLTPYLFSGDITLVGNEMLIPTDQGFYSFYPKELLSQEFHNSPRFTGLKVFSEDEKCDLLEKGQIILNYNENFFTINFSDFDFSETSSIYYYKLEGIDPDWVKTDQNYAAYTNIKYGKYKLLLSTDKNHFSSITPQSIFVIIKPPLWRKPWFLLLEIALILVFIYLMYLQKIKQYKRREKQLETEQRLFRSQMNPHFVFNALIAIQSFIFKNDPKEAGRYLSKFAKLMRLILQNTRQDYILLSQEIQTLECYLELQRLRFGDSFDFKIWCDESFDPDEVKLPPMMAQPFVENAIEHGFKGIEYKGKIHVDYFLKDGNFEILVRDNGIGINQSDLNKKHKSLAILITRERLQSFSRRSRSYHLEVKDLSEISKTETGTLVSLNVPYINAYNSD